jgi:amphiphysin
MTEVKLQQLEEAYQEAKRTFDEVTDVVYEELPALFDSRIEFYSTFFCNMTSLESKFHGEMHKVSPSINMQLFRICINVVG